MSYPLFAFVPMFDFEGRSRRSETIGFIGFVGAAIAFAALWEEQAGPVTAIVALLLALPLAATLVRRLHDGGRPAVGLALLLVPVVGQMIVLRWLVAPGNRGANRFGVDPKGDARRTAPATMYPFRRA